MRALKLTFVSTALVALYFATGLPVPGVVNAATCPLRGSCNLEPGLANRTDILLFEDFEATNWQAHWTGVSQPANWSAVTTQKFQGTKAVEARVPTGDHYGGALDFDFSSAGLSDPEEMYIRYYIRFNDTWQRTGDGEIGKLPGFGGVYGSGAGQGCSPVDGTNGWSARMMNFDRGSTYQVGFYAYHVDMNDDCGEHMVWSPQLQRHRWYAIEARVKLNTVGSSNGILEGWVDGQKVFSRTNLRFRTVSSLKIEKVWGNVYMGGSWVSDRNMALHMDNFVIARGPIGPAGAPPTSTAPGAPTNLRITR